MNKLQAFVKQFNLAKRDLDNTVKYCLQAEEIELIQTAMKQASKNYIIASEMLRNIEDSEELQFIVKKLIFDQEKDMTRNEQIEFITSYIDCYKQNQE